MIFWYLTKDRDVTHGVATNCNSGVEDEFKPFLTFSDAANVSCLVSF